MYIRNNTTTILVPVIVLTTNKAVIKLSVNHIKDCTYNYALRLHPVVVNLNTYPIEGYAQSVTNKQNLQTLISRAVNKHTKRNKVDFNVKVEWQNIEVNNDVATIWNSHFQNFHKPKEED